MQKILAALSALLDRDDPLPRPGDILPPLGHWRYFLPVHRPGSHGDHGHGASECSPAGRLLNIVLDDDDRAGIRQFSC